MKRSRLFTLRIICILASILSVASIVDGLFGMKQSISEDRAGQTDAGLGAILLIPFETGVSLVTAVSLFGSLVFLTTSPIDAWAPENHIRSERQRRFRISVIATVTLLCLVTTVVAVTIRVDNDVTWIIPGLVLYTLLSLIWITILSRRLRKLKNSP